MTLYDWKRLWCPRGSDRPLTEGGYLVDPEREHGSRHSLAPLSDFAEIPCLVLLGEPGIGKTTEFTAECERLKESREVVHRVDLNIFKTDSRLVDKSFGDRVVREWREGTGNLHLFFDSLDEGRLEIGNIANLLSSELRELKPFASRLRLRIACRTAEWPTSLETTLKEIWGEDNFSELTLAPLRRTDVFVAANAEGIDPEAFLTQVERIEAQPFAANPITLRFLLRTYLTSGALPRTKAELYRQGCHELCKEVSPTRHDSGHRGELSPDQGMKVAERIAAALVFSGGSAVSLRDNESSNLSVLKYSDLAGGSELAGEDRFEVSGQAVEETLRTALFVDVGTERVGFAHRTYAEFLAARYITNSNLDATQIDSLLFHLENPQKIIPQLAETSAWAATMDQRLFDLMRTNDPETLLRGDIATSDDTTKREFVSTLLQKFDAGQLDDAGDIIRAHAGKLSHCGVPDQLRPVLQDKQRREVTRQFAIDVVEECRVTELLGELAAIVLDTEDKPVLRRRASYALQRIGDDAAILRLRPLVLEKRADDSDDELRGNALRALWPRRLLTAEELFRSLRPPKDNSLLGAYRLFVSDGIHKHLRAEDLPQALLWCGRYFNSGGYDIIDGVRAVLGVAVRYLDQAPVLMAFADLLVARIEDLDQAPVPIEDWKQVSDERRRALLELVVPRIDIVRERKWQLFCFPLALIRHEDLPWLLDKASVGTDEERERWGILTRECFEQGNRSEVERILAACDANPLLSRVFAPLLSPVELNSEQAIRFRQMGVEQREREERRKQRKEEQAVVPSPAERVEECLALFEAGNLNGWWYLNRELQLAPEDTHYQHDFVTDITTFPGWLAANDATKQRVISAAQKYLLEWTPDYPSWLGTTTIHYPDWAGYRALVLVESQAPGFLSSIHTDIWVKCAPAIAGFPVNSGVDGTEGQTQSRLLKEACRHAPDTVEQAVLTLIDGEDQRGGSEHLWVLGALKNCTDSRMAECLLTKARDRGLKVPTIAGLIGHAMELWPESAERVAQELFTEALSLASPEESVQERARGLRRAMGALLWQRGENRWEFLWPHFQRDRDLFREVMIEACKEHGFRRIEKFSEQQLAELYLELSREFPHAEDANRYRVTFLGEREMVADCRDSVLQALHERGTVSAVAQVERIQKAMPQLPHLSWQVLKARRTMLKNTWQPTPVENVLALTRQPASRLVRNERELQGVVLESLQVLQDRFHGETPSVRDVWDKRDSRGKGKWRPIGENEFSDYVKRHLKSDLNKRGIVALREVEVRRGSAGEGERSDLYITASVQGSEDRSFETVRVIVEVKGCWHADLTTAMQAQLRDRYLKDNDCHAGIYVVAWFACDAWDPKDSRCKKTPKWAVDEAKSFFSQQAEELSADKILRAFVFDVSLR